MKNKFINPNEYGSLLYNKKENEYLNNVMTECRIFRYSKTSFSYSNMCEEKICDIVKSKYSLLTTNGTSGLKAALVGVGVKSGDKVLVSSYTFLATALAVISLGATPIPIEIDLNNGMNLEDVTEQIKFGCKAIIVVHFQGRTFDLSRLKKLIKNKNIALIEDACQAFPSSYNNIFAGTQGDVGVYSFQQFKQVSCGEGGCIVTDNRDIYNRIRNYTDMGSVRNGFPNWNEEDALFGENYRINNLNAAVLYAQLEKLPFMLEKQKDSRNRIMKQLKKHGIKNILESLNPEGDTSMNILIILNSKEDKLNAIKLALDKKIELRNMWSSVYYDNELFKKNKLTSMSLKGRDCIKTKELIEKMLVVSIPPILTLADEENIVELMLDLKKKNILR